MKILYDYRCHKCGVFEAYATREDTYLPEGCPQCGDIAKRIPIMPMVLTDTTNAGTQPGEPLRD